MTRCFDCNKVIPMKDIVCKNCKVIREVKEKEITKDYEEKRETKEQRNKDYPMSRSSGRRYL